jgi:hypothetical protein
MPATPAWPPQSAVRLFVEETLSPDAMLTIGGAQAHYLLNVMRLKAGTVLKLFDNMTGEWAAEVVATAKRDITLSVTAHLRQREPVPDLWLGAAPIRRARFDFLAEKACELGVARFTPVLTRRAVVDKVKPERLRAHLLHLVRMQSVFFSVAFRLLYSSIPFLFATAGPVVLLSASAIMCVFLACVDFAHRVDSFVWVGSVL